ncbi:MAG: hypothetical protein OQL19_00705, partial [Gammaproteobacteria bacterium]|nr:hypothetical protein [Gammaproteobacteria bacterium]
SNDKVSSYTLYASNHAYFPSGGTLKMNVSDASSLQNAWEEVVKIAENNSIYIAVKGIDSNNNTSELSNSVQLNLSSL